MKNLSQIFNILRKRISISVNTTDLLLILVVFTFNGCKKGATVSLTETKNLSFKISTDKIWLGINNILVNNLSVGYSDFEWQLDGTIISYDKIPTITENFYYPGKHYLKLTAGDSIGNQSVLLDSFVVYDKLEFNKIKILEVKSADFNIPVNPQFQDSLVGFFLQSPIDSTGNNYTPIIAANCFWSNPDIGWTCLLGGCDFIENLAPSAVYTPINFCKVGGTSQTYVKLYRNFNVLQKFKSTCCRFSSTSGIPYYSFLPDLATSTTYNGATNEFTVENDYLKVVIQIITP